MSEQPLHTGGCRCGAVRFSIHAEPHMTSFCHCDDCRKATGSPVAAFAGFRESEIEWQAEGYRGYTNDAVTRLFCRSCGAPIAYRDARLENRIYLMTGIMDQPERYAPELHAFGHRQLYWLAIEDGLPRLQGLSVRRPQPTQPDQNR